MWPVTGRLHEHLTPELERFVQGRVASGLYNNASEVIRVRLRLLREQDEVRLRSRQQIELGWQQARAVDGPTTVRDIKRRLKTRTKKRA